nr:MFS transporter [Euzebyales bacterium]
APAPASPEMPAASLPPASGGRGPARLPFVGLGFLISTTAYMLSNLFPVLATEYAGLSEAQTGLVYLISPALVLSGPGFGWLSDHVGRKPVLMVRSVANIASSLLYLAAPSFVGMAAGRAADDLGKAAFRPAWGSLMAHVASFDRRRRARTMGLISMGDDAGEIVGPILAGLLWSTWGVAVLLLARVGLAVATEIYAVVVSRSLREPPGDPPLDPAGAGRQPAVPGVTETQGVG